MIESIGMVRLDNFGFIIFFVLFISASCVNGRGLFKWKDGKVIITGKLIALEHHPYSTVKFKFADLLKRERIYTAEIAEDGSFRAQAQVLFSQEFTMDFGYGYLTTHICSPGDSLYFEIDATASSQANGQRCLTFIGGTSAQPNIEINKYLSELSDVGLLLANSANTNAVKGKMPTEYMSYVKEREEIHRGFLNEFNKKYKTSILFQTWAEDKVKFQSLHDLLNYSWRRPAGPALPYDYFSFLRSYDMNNRNVVSHIHADFVHELFQHVTRVPTRLRLAVDSAIEVGDYAAAVLTLQQMIKLNSSGFTRDVLLSKLAMDVIYELPAEAFEILYDSTAIADDYLRESIATEHIRATTKSKNINIFDVEARSTAELLRQIEAKFRGKVMYIDFWGPWCGPCLKEIPYSKKIQEWFRVKEVVFLNFAFDTNEKNWNEAISKYDIDGEHFLLNKDQFNIFSSILGIDSAPRYILVDREGNVVLNDAPRPSDGDNLIRAIEEVLNKWPTCELN